MTTRITRRRLLKVAGTGVFATIAAPVAADDRGQAIVYVHPTATQGEAVDAVLDHGGDVRHRYRYQEFISAAVPAVDAIRRDARVETVNPVKEVYAHDHRDPSRNTTDCDTHPDPAVEWGVDRIGAPSAHARGVTGDGVGIAILDTGIQKDHCDLKDNVQEVVDMTALGNDTDDHNGHGTHVSGIAAAADNDLGVLGVAPDAELYGVKVLGNGGIGFTDDILAGIEWADANDIPIISMSLGSDRPCSEEERDVINRAFKTGHLLVASAGNAGNDEDGGCDEDNVGSPARCENVLATSAMDPDDSLAGYSSVGPEIDLMAPGTDVRSTYRNNRYETLSGTSMAAPHASGVAALVWADRSLGEPEELEGATVRDVLADTAEPVLETCEEGAGLVDADHATK